MALLVLGIAALAIPWRPGALPSRARPFTTYADAAQRVDSLRAGQQSDLNPACVVKLMSHGRSAENAIVFVHGYTSCPQQFDELGRRFFDLGYNVLIAPLPHHGLKDRMSTDQALLTAEELGQYADEVLDIAGGLGKHVTIAGFSGGGVVAAWAAQNREDVDLAVVMAPAFGFKQIPTPLTGAAMNVLSILPNSFTWWDPVHKNEGGIPYAYPRYSTRALTQFMRLGFYVEDAARRGPAAASRILVITNGNEPSVNNELTLELVDTWRLNSTEVTAYEFPASLGLPHDLIDPLQPDQNIDTVYPMLIDLIAQPRGLALLR